MTQNDGLDMLRQRLKQFVAERDWAQFHTPKNLASALSVEAAELLEPFQWLKNGRADELSVDQKQAVRHEMADVLHYLILLADQLDVNLIAASLEKMAINEKRYPVANARGNAKKYTDQTKT